MMKGKKAEDTDKDVIKARDVVNIDNYVEQVVKAYNEGRGDEELPADFYTARSIIPPGTSRTRDFTHLGSQIPEFIPEKCVGCMECISLCPDTAILAKVIENEVVDDKLWYISDEEENNFIRKQLFKTQRFWHSLEKRGEKPGIFAIFADPLKCKGCGLCVKVCGQRGALKMVTKTGNWLEIYKKGWKFIQNLGETAPKFITKSPLDMMLSEKAILYLGGVGSCPGCMEAITIRMLLAATGFVYGKESICIVNSTGCSTVCASNYPYNPYLVCWTNSLFENSPTVAMGIRAMWDKYGWKDKRVWVFGGDGAIVDIGFQALSRLLVSGMDIKTVVFDTQVYSNTGGQASMTTFMGQETKFSFIGKAIKGKTEKRKELAQICMMHPDTYVAATTPAYPIHFYKAIMGANEFHGPAVVISYCACTFEHGIADDIGSEQSKLAVTSRAVPLLIYDPRKGSKIKERLDLSANPSFDKDWHTDSTEKPIDFITFAKTEGRFAKQFDKDGNPSKEILASQEERLANWRQLQELAGIR